MFLLVHWRESGALESRSGRCALLLTSPRLPQMSSNCSFSQVCWPTPSDNTIASAQHAAFAVDVPFSHVSTGGAIKRVSRQKNLSTPDIPSAVWLYTADSFDGGQTVCCLALLTHCWEITYPAVTGTSFHEFFLCHYLHIWGFFFSVQLRFSQKENTRYASFIY